MNTDIRLSVGFWQHPKTKKLARRLGLEAVRSLQILWLWAAQNRPDGNLSGMDWEDLELAADWQGEDRAFFDCCMGVWIDEGPDGFSLHDWKEHNAWASEADDRSDQARLSRLATVNREVYAELKAKGVTGISKEEYERLKASRRSSDDRLTTVQRPSDERQTTVERSSTNRPTPAPAPAQEDNISLSAGAPARVADIVPSPPKNSFPSKGESDDMPDITFEQFADAYPPDKLDTDAAWVAWKLQHKRGKLPGLCDLLTSVEAWKASEQWRSDGGAFIPLASNFLGKAIFRRLPPAPRPARASPQRVSPARPGEFDPDRQAQIFRDVLADLEAEDAARAGYATQAGGPVRPGPELRQGVPSAAGATLDASARPVQR